MKKLAFIIMLALSVQAQAQTPSDNKDILTMLATAKMTGSCGMLYSMMDFQKATKLSGGDEFLSRFIMVELARLNIPMQTYFDLCAESIKKYDAIWSSVDNPTQ